MIHLLVALKLLPGAGGTTAAVTVPIGRRRRTRTYRTPSKTPIALEMGYKQLKREGVVKPLRRLVGPYLLLGNMPKAAAPPATRIDWEALMQDIEAVEELIALYERHVEDEDTAILLLTEI